jgi:hypothetical protein
MGFAFSTLCRIGLVMILVGAADAGAETAIQPAGQYAEIDIKQTREAMQLLATGTMSERGAAIAGISAHSEQYAPPVFYAMSEALFQAGNRDEAAFWFYAGQLRARFDANRCTDESARQAVPALNQRYGPAINQYAFQDLQKLEAVVNKVVAWDRQTPHNYDQRWINLHGMNAMLSGLGSRSVSGADAPLSLPAERWDAIAEQTRADYLKGFQEALAMAKRNH